MDNYQSESSGETSVTSKQRCREKLKFVLERCCGLDLTGSEYGKAFMYTPILYKTLEFVARPSNYQLSKKHIAHGGKRGYE
jgi:hypothetical protein